MAESLKQQAIFGIIWSSIQKFGTLIISFLSNLVLARLLSPTDFGTIGILMVFIALSGTLVDGGFGSALIQKKNPTNTDYSTIFYWNIILAIFLYAFLFLTAPAIASFYDESALSELLRVLGIILLINSFNIIQSNILTKNLKFKVLAQRDLISTSIGAIVAITLAYKGFGIWSLVVNHIVIGIIKSILLWAVCSWRPQLIFNYGSFKELFGFGGFILSSNLINTLCNNIQGLIIGKVFTIQDVGFYTQARKLEEIPSTSFSAIVVQVAYPIFSKVQNDLDKLKNALQRISMLMASFVFPAMILLIVIAKPLIIFLFTDKWSESIPYFQILCIGGIAISLQNINYSVVAALGRSRSLFKWTVIKRSLGLIFLGVGTLFGMKGLLFGVVLGSYLIYIINASLASHYLKYSLISQLRDLIGILIISVITGLIVYYLSTLLSLAHYLIIFIISIMFLLVYILLLRIFYNTLFQEIKSLVKNYLIWRK